MRRRNSVLRQHQHEGLAPVDRVNNAIGIRGAGRHVPWRDPALDTTALQSSDNGIGNRCVLRGVAYEYVGRARTNTSPLLFAAAFSHVDPLPLSTLCWQMLPVFIKVYLAPNLALASLQPVRENGVNSSLIYYYFSICYEIFLVWTRARCGAGSHTLRC